MLIGRRDKGAHSLSTSRRQRSRAVQAEALGRRSCCAAAWQREKTREGRRKGLDEQPTDEQRCSDAPSGLQRPEGGLAQHHHSQTRLPA